MRKLSSFFYVIISLVVLLFTSCDSDSSGSTSPEIDTEVPTVEFSGISDGDEVSDTFKVSISAFDNEEIQKIALYIDDEEIETSNSSQHEFSVNSNDYLDGVHKLTAKAWDTSDNFSVENIEVIVANPDTEAPTVVFVGILDGEEVSGIFKVSINASDNKEIQKIALYLDDEEIGTSNSSQHEFSVNSNNYLDGNHTLTAKAWDTSNNFSVENIEVNTTYDFAPLADGQIKVSITHYKEIDPVDAYGYGDPYFIYELRINEEVYDTYTSQIWEDTYEIDFEVSHTFNIPDDTREYQLVVYVRDNDASGYDQLDYTDSPSGSAFIWTLKTDSHLTHDFTGTYNGEDDGSSNFDDDDCEITLKVEMID